jgi:hypothetical protein
MQMARHGILENMLVRSSLCKVRLFLTVASGSYDGVREPEKGRQQAGTATAVLAFLKSSGGRFR